MSEDNKKLTKEDIVSEEDDLESFAQALLNKKTELILFPEDLENIPDEPLVPDPEEKKAAETAMSEALDKLRQERGQPTIAQEEENFDAQTRLVHDIVKENRQEQEEKEKEEALKRSRKHFKMVSFSKEGDKKVKVYKMPKVLSLDEKKKRIIMAVGAVLLLAAAAFGLYTWKVLVYNPNNISSEQQQKAYDKLIDYADEYSSGLMSDAEKLEILSLKEGYDGLLQKQKDEINAYFREQTKTGKGAGRSFMDIYNEELQMKKDAEDQAQPEYQALMDYLANWEDKTEEERQQIVQYKETYDSLTDTLKYNVDALSREVTGATFPETYNSYRLAQDEGGSNEDKRAEWQAKLDSLNAELATYQAYASQLQATLEAQQAAGQDIADTQAAIDNNNAYMDDLNKQIRTVQHQLDISQ